MAIKMRQLLALTLTLTLTTILSASSGVVVSDVVTQKFFEGIKSQAAVQGDCPGREFYTRQAFLNALGSYGNFGTTGSADDSKREIAAFFAHATHETGYFCYKDQQADPKPICCDTSSAEARKYPCNPSKKYFGRGPLQLTWNYNYGPAGQALRFDGLNAPETLSADPTLSFKSALWFWFHAGVHSLITSEDKGFGATIKAINGGQECNGKNSGEMNDRITLYKNYCSQFGVAPGNNLSC